MRRYVNLGVGSVFGFFHPKPLPYLGFGFRKFWFIKNIGSFRFFPLWFGFSVSSTLVGFSVLNWASLLVTHCRGSHRFLISCCPKESTCQSVICQLNINSIDNYTCINMYGQLYKVMVSICSICINIFMQINIYLCFYIHVSYLKTIKNKLIIHRLLSSLNFIVVLTCKKNWKSLGGNFSSYLNSGLYISSKQILLVMLQAWPRLNIIFISRRGIRKFM